MRVPKLPKSPKLIDIIISFKLCEVDVLDAFDVLRAASGMSTHVHNLHKKKCSIPHTSAKMAHVLRCITASPTWVALEHRIPYVQRIQCDWNIHPTQKDRESISYLRVVVARLVEHASGGIEAGEVARCNLGGHMRVHILPSCRDDGLVRRLDVSALLSFP